MIYLLIILFAKIIIPINPYETLLKNNKALAAEKIEDEKCHRLVELNVQEQIFNLAKTSIMQLLWKKVKSPDLHRWVYGLKDGVIKPVFEMKAGTHIDPLYEYDDH